MHAASRPAPPAPPGLATPTALAALALVAGLVAGAPGAAAQPEQVHASWLGDGRVGVAWARPGDVAAESDDVLRLVLGGQGVLDVQPSSRVHIGPGVTIHKAEVDVDAAAWAAGVSYQVGSDAQRWSRVFGLPALPAPGDPWRIVAYGDHGVGAESNASALLVPAVAERRPHAVLHLGDIAYADGTPAVWDEWFRMVEPLAATTWYMPTPGNHEHEGWHLASGPSADQATFTGSATDPYEQYRQRFHLPGSSLRYSVDIGPVHLVSINSEDVCVTQPATYPVPWRVSLPCAAENQLVPSDGQDRPLPPNQELLDWLDADLAAHADAPWTFVMFHRPVYSAGAYSGEAVLRQHFVPVFERHGVDLVLSGHDHNYQRSFPLRDGEPASGAVAGYARDVAPIYVVSGGAGEGYYGLSDPAPSWTAARTTAFHFLALDVWEDGLRLSVVDTLTGETLDSFTVGAVPLAAGVADRDAPALPVALLAAALAAVGMARLRLAGRP